MPKIAFISSNEWASWGGAEELWGQAALKLADQKFHIGVNVKQWPEIPEKIQWMGQSGVEVHFRSTRSDLLWRLAWKFYGADILYRWLDRFQPNLVVISQATSFDGLAWMIACQKRNIPYVIICQAAAENFWLCDDETVDTAIKAYQKSERVFFVSHANLSLVCKQLAVDLPNATIVHNPFNASYHAALPWPDDEIIKLACVARLEPMSKGQDLLFEVMRLEKWHSRSIEVTLYGNGSNQESLKRLQKLWQIENVKFGGFVKNIENIWEKHHALVLPSRYEGLPLAVVEAMLCGRCCIVTDVGGNTEFIQDNISGFVASTPTTSALDEAMERFWLNQDNLQKIGQVAALHVRKKVPADPVSAFVDELKKILISL